MAKVCVLTDSNSGITQAEARQLGCYVIPMPFYINGEEFLEEITLSQEEFYKYLEEGAEVKTSQPAPGTLLEKWDELLEEYDEIVHIPMSSGLSSSMSTAAMLAEDYEGKVYVVDNQRISVTQRDSVIDAVNMVKAGKSGAEIKQRLTDDKFESSIYITLDTLDYLKKGGRITPAAAAIGTVLKLKPVLQIQGEKLDAYSKARGWKIAKKTMLDAMEEDFNTRFAGKKMKLDLAYTYDVEAAKQWAEEIHERFPQYPEPELSPLSLSVSCHIGPGALAIATSMVEEV